MEPPPRERGRPPAHHRPALNLGLGVRVFANRGVSFRFDVTNNVVFVGATRIIQVPTLQLSTAFNFGATE